MNNIKNGVWPTMLTPFTKDNKIDYSAVEQLINWYTESGVSGIFAVCQSSEMFFLSSEEKENLLEFICKNNPAGLPLVASGHTADNIYAQIEDAKRLYNKGIEAFVIVSNRFDLENKGDDEFKRNAEIFMNAVSDMNLGIYECPYPYQRLLSPDLLKWCAETGRFTFLKDTSCNSDVIHLKLEAVKGTNLKIFNANSATLLETLQMGAAGFSGIMSNIHPDLYVWLCNNYNEKCELVQKISDYLSVSSMTETQTYPICAKYYLNKCGLSIDLHSRMRNADDITFSQKIMIDKLYRLNKECRKLLNANIKCS